EVFDAAADERLDSVALAWDERPAVTVVMASEGYPGHYERDRVIQHLEAAERLPDVKVFHAGTTLRADGLQGREARIVTAGGPLLKVAALGDPLVEARTRASEAARVIKFPGAWFRQDIAGSVPRAGR